MEVKKKKSHARWSPSKLSALKSCPCFSYREAGEQDDTSAAAEGEDLHRVLETGNPTGLSESQIALVVSVQEKLDAIIATGDFTEFRERELTLEGLTYGTADFVLISKDDKLAHIVDFKFGRKQVEDVENNFQVRTYCAALMESMPEITECWGHILAPRARDSEFKFDRSLIEQVRNEIEALYKVLDDPFKQPNAVDEELCALCANASRCPKMTQTAITVARDLVGLPVPASFAPGALVSVRDRLIAHLVAGALVNWAEQVKENNNAFVEQGGEIPGLIKTGRSLGKKIPKESTPYAFETLRQAGYGSPEMLLSAASISISDLAKAASEIRGTKESDERARICEILGDVVTESHCSYLQKSRKADVAQLLRGS